MSPRRMDISSLLRDPSPPRNPSSLLSILNTTDAPDRQAFLGLDVLVHAASEERHRIDTDHTRHYAQPAPSRPHKRTRGSRSPSPLPSSASPVNLYPTLRRHHIDPTRVAPPFDDSHSIPHPALLPTSPFPHHSSPRNSSPHRHSPQQFRPQPHPSPTHFAAFAEAPYPMSPRYGHGPRMAGGIEILSNDPPRPDLSTFQSPRQDLSPLAERLVSEGRSEHPPSRVSPLSTRLFSFDDDRHPSRASLHHLDTRETDLHRDWPRSRPLPLSSPSVDHSMDTTRSIFTPANAVEFRPLERHPIRVWEEQPIHVAPASRQISSPERRRWSGTTEIGHSMLPVKREMPTESVTENVLTPSFTYEAPPLLPRAPTPEYTPSVMHIPVERTSTGRRPSEPTSTQHPSPALSDTHLSHALHPPRMPASPVIDPDVKTFETQSKCQSDRFDASAAEITIIPPKFSDPVVAEPIDAIPPGEDVDGVPVASPPPRSLSPGSAIQPALSRQSGTHSVSTHPTPVVTASHDTSRSPSQPPSTESVPNASSEDIVIQPESTHQSRETEDTSERGPPVSEQTMMDVEEELLSLIGERPVHVIPPTPKVQIQPALPSPTTLGGSAERGSNEVSDSPSLAASSQLIPKGSALTEEDKDRVSMPPPAARNKKAEKDKSTGSKKKKDATSKPPAKAKQTSKPRAKAVPKAKSKSNGPDASSKSSIPKGLTNVNARSRSASVIPGVLDEVIPEQDPIDSDKEDDKLYCVCKTGYDEDRMMIACDRCDEWFHTLCVNMPDLEIDLVDQFICPPCIQKSPHLRTTWKRRCLFGLQHENPSSPEACHKPSRGAFSKYCSDDCGIKYMRARIARWETSGGARDLLWDSVKNAAKREGVVVYAETSGTSHSEMDVDDHKPLDSAAKRRAEREITRLNARLEEVVKERELMKRELDMVMWREKVVELASERAGKMEGCGWDQRLCFGEEEWVDFGLEVLESYEEERTKMESGGDPTSLDATSPGEWWCTGKKKCRRHAGWQKLRAAEVSFDKETKEGILLKLTSREREIRKSIEDLLYPQPTGTLQASSELLHPDIQTNGTDKPPLIGLVSERGRKRTS